jgi:hypothetical protein
MENLLLKHIAQNAVTIKLIGGLDNYVLRTRAKYDSFDASRVVIHGANMTSSLNEFCPRTLKGHSC